MNLPRQIVIYKTASECAIALDVYQIPGNAPQPCLVWLHGGALIFGDRGMLPPDQAQRYLQAGYTVIAPDYRLAPETKLDAILEDVHDAVDWIRANGPGLWNIDPGRLGIVGHSAGGYLTLLAGCGVHPRPRALVSFYGYGDIAGDWYSQPDPFYCRQPMVPKAEADRVVGGQAISGSPIDERARFYLYCRQQGRWAREVAGFDPVRERAKLDPYCPVRNLPADYPPTLLLHGDQDQDVPWLQSVAMAIALERQGVCHALVILPNQGHAFDSKGAGLRQPVIAAVFDRVVDFLNKHLQAAAQAESST